MNMNDEARFMTSLWSALSDFISTADKQEAADTLVKEFIEEGHELETLYDADGDCPYLDRALATAQIDHDEEMEIDEDEEV